MRKRAFVDIVILALVFWSIWSLRFAEVQNVGLWSILAAVGAGAVLMAMRKESWRDIGLCAGGNARFVLSRAGEFSILALVTGFTVIGIATALGYPPSQSAVLSQQPETLSGFLVDIVFGVWVGAAIGEELFFRGMLLSKFTTLVWRWKIGIGTGSSRTSYLVWCRPRLARGQRHDHDRRYRCRGGYIFPHSRPPRPNSSDDRSRTYRYCVTDYLLYRLRPQPDTGDSPDMMVNDCL